MSLTYVVSTMDTIDKIPFIFIGIVIAVALDNAIIQKMSSPFDWVLVAVLSVGEVWILFKFASSSPK